MRQLLVDLHQPGEVLRHLVVGKVVEGERPDADEVEDDAAVHVPGGHSYTLDPVHPVVEALEIDLFIFSSQAAINLYSNL